MPCRSDEEEAQIPESPNPVTPTKPPRNDGAGYDNSDAEFPLTQSDQEEEERSKQKRKRVIAEYEAVKRWVTGERAVQPADDIERELFEEARESMHLSGLKKLPGHKGLGTHLHLWKKASGPAPGVRHERECRTPFIAVLCGIGARLQVHEDYPRRERKRAVDTGAMRPARRAQSQ